MHAELPTVSFLCVASLLLVAPVYASSRNIPVLSLAAWLICCNLIHGINALVWAGNSAEHIPAWCDIVTRVLLAAQLALPGSALALVMKLRRCALGQETTGRRSPVAMDVILCLALPMIYIITHVIVQPHRFDIAAEFGCVASIHTSSVSIILIWIPPLLLCATTFVYTFLAIRARLESGLFFFSHMQDAPRMSMLAFIRPLVISVSITLISLSMTIFSMTAHLVSVGGLQAWAIDSWAQVHAEMSQVFVIPPTSHLILKSVEADWWAIPAYTLVFVAMTGLAFIHPESLKPHGPVQRWFHRAVLRRSPEDSFSQAKSFGGQTLCSSPSSPTSMYEMKAGWDDTWRPSAPAKVKLPPLVIPAAPSETTIAFAEPEQDDLFARSTMRYVESPTGREALGLPPIPPAIYEPGRRNGSVSPPMTPPRVASPPKPNTTLQDGETAQARPDSMILSSGAWPRPPSTIPASPRTPSPKTPVMVTPASPVPPHSPSSSPRPPSILSMTTSLASSTISVGGYAYDDEPYVAPFQDSVSDAPGPGLAVPKHIRKVRSRDMLLPRSFSVSSRGRRNGSNGGLSEGIYMTVVKETE
ncbi:pheromone receptor [Trametes sanguinea]|nr:pheromone receptor [Trametes sanguinea]